MAAVYLLSIDIHIFYHLFSVMNFLGSIIKASIAINQRLSFADRDEEYEQSKSLQDLLSKARATAFGKFYGFEEIIRTDKPYESFANEVPIFDYYSLHDQWLKQQQVRKDITWPGHPGFFALSSGTTGSESKRLPITDDFIESVRAVGVSLVKDLPNYNFDEKLFESEILMLSSSAALTESGRGFKEGEISGINVSNFPSWYDLFYRPGKEIASIDDWDERIERIAREAPNWNIGAIAGIPSWVLVMLREVLKYNQVDNIHQLWPNLKVFVSGGVAFETYRRDFEEVCGEPIHIMDTYLASEGFFAYTDRPDSLEMKLATHHGYFYEFIPFDDKNFDELGNLRKDATAVPLAGTTPGKEYAILVSSCAGLWRYFIGDTVKIVSRDPTRIVLTGRTKFWLNVAGSQLSEEKLDKAINELSQAIGQSINEYSVAALPDGEGTFNHTWVIVVERPRELNSNDLAGTIDKYLNEANKNYRVARRKALTDIHVLAVSKGTYHEYLSKVGKKGGQTKTPKVMTEQKMRQYLSFLETSERV
jgi:hypothetical protein